MKKEINESDTLDMIRKYRAEEKEKEDKENAERNAKQMIKPWMYKMIDAWEAMKKDNEKRRKSERLAMAVKGILKGEYFKVYIKNISTKVIKTWNIVYNKVSNIIKNIWQKYIGVRYPDGIEQTGTSRDFLRDKHGNVIKGKFDGEYKTTIDMGKQNWKWNDKRTRWEEIKSRKTNIIYRGNKLTWIENGKKGVREFTDKIYKNKLFIECEIAALRNDNNRVRDISWEIDRMLDKTFGDNPKEEK
jgi:hypothetical protein